MGTITATNSKESYSLIALALVDKQCGLTVTADGKIQSTSVRKKWAVEEAQQIALAYINQVRKEGLEAHMDPKTGTVSEVDKDLDFKKLGEALVTALTSSNEADSAAVVTAITAGLDAMHASQSWSRAFIAPQLNHTSLMIQAEIFHMLEFAKLSKNAKLDDRAKVHDIVKSFAVLTTFEEAVAEGSLTLSAQWGKRDLETGQTMACAERAAEFREILNALKEGLKAQFDTEDDFEQYLLEVQAEVKREQEAAKNAEATPPAAASASKPVVKEPDDVPDVPGTPLLHKPAVIEELVDDEPENTVAPTTADDEVDASETQSTSSEDSEVSENSEVSEDLPVAGKPVPPNNAAPDDVVLTLGNGVQIRSL